MCHISRSVQLCGSSRFDHEVENSLSRQKYIFAPFDQNWDNVCTTVLSKVDMVGGLVKNFVKEVHIISANI